MSGTISETSGGASAVTDFGAGDASVPAAIGGGGTAGPSVGAGNTTGTVASVNTAGVDLAGLPAQYSTAGAEGTGLGFFSRQLEYVPTAVAVGPDGALYVGGLSGLPYPEGYARIFRVADAEATTGFDGRIPSGVPEVYASGFSQINGLSFDGKGNLYVLEYENSATIYDPTKQPNDLPPSQLIRVSPDGVRTTISGPELKLGNYVFAGKTTGDVYVSINNDDINNGQVLRYRFDEATGKANVEVVASGLNNPRGMAFGPDGRLYVNEQGVGAPSDSPDAATAPLIPFIPGFVNERGGYTASITRVELDADGGQERIFTGLPSIREVNAVTGEDRIISVGSNGFTIAPDGTAYVATGGGLSAATAGALGEFGNYVQGLLRIEGLFDDDPSDAAITPTFNSVRYAGENGPDGSQTLFNNQSNLNDVVVGSDGKLYTVDAARNVMYGFEENGDQVTPNSATVFQKQPPVLTPPQYTAVVAAGGNPSADYRVEIASVTGKAANGAPDTPGRAQAAAIFSAADTGAAVAGAPSDRNGFTASDESLTAANGGTTTVASTESPSTDTTAGSRGEDASVGVANAAAAGVPGQVIVLDPSFPGPIDPISPPVRADNVYAYYFDPFFGGNYDPGTPRVLPAGENGGLYTVSRVFSFGDRLSDDGGTYGVAAVAQTAGQPAPNAASLYYQGGYSDGPMWTENLERILGVHTDEDRSFAYVNATARAGIFNPFDQFQSTTGLTSFGGQIDAFQQAYGSFTANDLVTVGFGGNDVTFPSDVAPEEGVALSVEAVVDGLERLADLGARHFLVANAPNVELSPLFETPGFLEQIGSAPGVFTSLVDQLNAQLVSALDAFEQETGLDVRLLDVNKLFASIVADPAAYGFTNVDQPVLALPPIQPGTPEVYNPAIVGQDPAVRHATLFLDPEFHPTALGHAILGETARNALTA